MRRPRRITTALTITTTPIVTLKGNQAFANSKDVAAFFGKDHKNVLRDISALIDVASSIALNFEPIEIAVKVGFGTRMDPAFDMTKDGFTLLAMGLTGTKALQFKLAYIAAFNELEAKANAAVMALPDFTNPAAAARAWRMRWSKSKRCRFGAPPERPAHDQQPRCC